MRPITPSLTVTEPEEIDAAIVAHLAGTAPLSGLDLYYLLERTTSLLAFHTMLRPGPRNRTRAGLQQSYGDHNRLLMLALDRLLAGDAEWLRTRVEPGTTIDDDALRTCADHAAGLSLPADVEVALWLGAALHDCGRLGGRTAHVDVEDGVEIARPLLDGCCPPSTRALAGFALRHHDYVKDVFLGEAPVGLVADDLDHLAAAQRPIGLAALGLIQVAGAASLGEGRLTDFRLGIFRACINGDALADRSPARRLARLLDAPAEGGSAGPVPAGLAPLLDGVAVHGWHAFAREANREARLAALDDLARVATEWRADHLVLADGLGHAGLVPPTARPSASVALSGSRIVTLLP